MYLGVHYFGYAKISDFHNASPVQKYIRGLQIPEYKTNMVIKSLLEYIKMTSLPMQDVLRVHVVDGTGDLFEYGYYISFRKMQFSLPLGDDLGQGTSIGVLHLDKQSVVLDEATEVAHNIRMM